MVRTYLATLLLPFIAGAQTPFAYVTYSLGDSIATEIEFTYDELKVLSENSTARIVYVQLYDEINAILPNFIWHLHDLRALDVEMPLLRSLPVGIGNLKHLTTWSCKCGLTTADSDLDMSQLDELTEITLIGTDFEEFPTQLLQPKYLQELNVINKSPLIVTRPRYIPSGGIVLSIGFDSFMKNPIRFIGPWLSRDLEALVVKDALPQLPRRFRKGRLPILLQLSSDNMSTVLSSGVKWSWYDQVSVWLGDQALAYEELRKMRKLRKLVVISNGQEVNLERIKQVLPRTEVELIW